GSAAASSIFNPECRVNVRSSSSGAFGGDGPSLRHEGTTAATMQRTATLRMRGQEVLPDAVLTSELIPFLAEGVSRVRDRAFAAAGLPRGRPLPPVWLDHRLWVGPFPLTYLPGCRRRSRCGLLRYRQQADHRC